MVKKWFVFRLVFRAVHNCHFLVDCQGGRDRLLINNCGFQNSESLLSLISRWYGRDWLYYLHHQRIRACTLYSMVEESSNMLQSSPDNSVFPRDPPTRLFGRVLCHLDAFGQGGQPLKWSNLTFVIFFWSPTRHWNPPPGSVNHRIWCKCHEINCCLDWNSH